MIPDIIRKQARSAITGRWVPMWRVWISPGTTVVETVRYPPSSRVRLARGTKGVRRRPVASSQ